MVNLGNFDANQHEPRKALDPLPAGWYAAQIVDSDVVKTKDGTGQYLTLEFELLEQYHPEHKGRRVWERLNLWHSKQQVVDIANRTLSAICHATGVLSVQDTQALHHRPLAVKVKQRAATPEYEASNDITGYDGLAARFGQGAPVSAGTMVPPAPGRVAGPPPATAVARPPAAPQGQPGQGGPPAWRRQQTAATQPAAQQEPPPPAAAQG